MEEQEVKQEINEAMCKHLTIQIAKLLQMYVNTERGKETNINIVKETIKQAIANAKKKIKY